jgi:hypothetical protein
VAARLKSGPRRLAKFTQACLDGVGAVQERDKLRALAPEAMQLAVERNIAIDMRFFRQRARRVRINQAPLFGLDGRGPALYPCQLPFDMAMVRAGLILEEVHAPPELQRIEHHIADHLEDLGFKYVRLNLRVAAALNEGRRVRPLLRPPVTLVRRLCRSPIRWCAAGFRVGRAPSTTRACWR